jgi:hypothetical protein
MTNDQGDLNLCITLVIIQFHLNPVDMLKGSFCEIIIIIIIIMCGYCCCQHVQYWSCTLNVLMELNCRAVGQTRERLRVQRDTGGLEP